LLKGDPEFLTDRVRKFFADQLESRCERVSGTHCASEQVHRFGELLLKLVKSSLAHHARN